MKKVGIMIKEDIVEKIKYGFKDHSNIFVISHTNLDGGKSVELRMGLKKVGAEMYASKNRIASLTLKNLGYDDLAEKISDQTLFVWTDTESVQVAKVVMEFIKDNDNIMVQGALIDGDVVSSHDVQKLSDLPVKSVLQSMLLSVLQAPVSRLLGAFNAKSMDLLSILKQLSKKKGE